MASCWFSGSSVSSSYSGQSIPPWRKFLSYNEDRTALANFLSSHVTEEGMAQIKHSDHVLILAGDFIDGTVIRCFSSHGVTEPGSMQSTHVEADTRLLLHTVLAYEHLKSLGVRGRIVIQASDTDVPVLLVHYFPKLDSTEELWMYCVHTSQTVDKHHYIPIHSVCGRVARILCDILPSAHANTGCDSVSSFHGFGKKKELAKLIMGKTVDNYTNLKDPGQSFTQDCFEAAERMIVALYEP